MIPLLVLVGGALGAVSRFLVDHTLTGRLPGPLPWGTLTVNVVGSMLLGLLGGVGSTVPGWLGALLGTGFCGALTTYSTFSHETVRLITAQSAPARAGRAGLGWRAGPGWAGLNVGLTLGLGLGAAALGRLLATTG